MHWGPSWPPLQLGDMSEASKTALAYGLTATVLLSAAFDLGWLGLGALFWLGFLAASDEPTDQ